MDRLTALSGSQQLSKRRG